MSIIPGVFSHTALLQARDLADRMMLDGRVKQQYVPKTTAFQYLQNLQTASLNQAFNARPGKKYEVEIMWENVCADLTIADESCAIGGPEASTNTKVYELEKRIVKGFTIDDDKYRTNEFDSATSLAKLLLVAEKQIAEEFTQYALGRLNVFAGVNQVALGKGVINGLDPTITDIDPANWTAEIMAYFSRVIQLNRFSNAAMITGSNLYETLFVASANAANSEGKGDQILWNGMPIWFDLFNVDAVNGQELFTYMVEQGSIAMVNKTFNIAGTNFHDQRYTIPCRFLPGWNMDLYYTNNCNDDGTHMDMLKHHWKIVLTADIFNNPFGCDAIEDGFGVQTGGENSGILRFRNAVPEPAPTPTPTV